NQEITNLRNLIQAKQPYDLQNLRVLLNQASQFGIPGAIPFSRGGSDPLTTADLLTQGDVINQEMKRRAALANPIDAKNNPLPISAQDRLKAVFGPGFLGLPFFSLKGNNLTEIDQALKNGPKQVQMDAQKPDSFVVRRWFQKASRTRP